MWLAWKEAAAIGAICVAVVMVIISSGVYRSYKDSHSQTIELRKDDWVCTKHERTTYLQPMTVGKQTIMQPMARVSCVEYRTKGD